MILEDIRELSIYEVEKVRSIFLKVLSTEEDLNIDMKQIEKIDMVGIQLLLSLVKSARARDKKVSFINLRENVLQEIKACHCSEALGIIDE